MLREGSWWIESKSDPRWNMKGRGTVGGFSCPPDAREAIERKKKELEEDPPDDLTYEYFKD